MAFTGPDQRDTSDPGVPPSADGDRETRSSAQDRGADPYHVRAKHLLMARTIWTVPLIVSSVMLVLITVFYIGSVVDPVAHLRGLPISIVNQDTGASIGSQRIDLGAQLQSGLTGSRTVSTLLALTPERLPAAESRMNRNGAYATVVIPPNFTASLLSLTGARVSSATPAGKPTVELLANRRAGTVGVQLAAGVLTPAIAKASQRIGRQLSGAARPPPSAGTATAAVLAERNQIVQLRLSIVDRELASAHDRASKQRQLSALQKTLSHEEAALQRQATLAAVAAFGAERIPVNTTPGSYIDPLQFVNLWERTDQGVDATMPVGAPILAPTRVKILAIEPNWYAGQPLVYFELLQGQQAGQVQYVAEEITDIAPPGSILQQGQTIAKYAAHGTAIEYGWSTLNGITLAKATTGYEEGEITPAGTYMRNWLNALGANAGPWPPK